MTSCYYIEMDVVATTRMLPEVLKKHVEEAIQTIGLKTKSVSVVSDLNVEVKYQSFEEVSYLQLLMKKA